MSGFQTVSNVFETLRAAEHAMPANDDTSEQNLHEATVATDAAFSRMIRYPASNGTQAAAKLASAVAQYPGFGGGMEEGDLSFVIVECMRFLIAGALRDGAA